MPWQLPCDKIKPLAPQRGRLEGRAKEGWLLVDFGDVIVHLLSPDRRDYYRLEELWSQGKVLAALAVSWSQAEWANQGA